MKNVILIRSFAPCCLICICQLAHAQYIRDTSKYDQHKVFSPLFYPSGVNEYRSASGAPGPKYWQNRADYKLEVLLDTINHHISGTTSIDYTNNSPDKMTFVWLQLDQNLYREDSRSHATKEVEEEPFANKSYTKGDEIESVSILKNGQSQSAEYLITDTRLLILLKDTLEPAGNQIRIRIKYGFDIPDYGIDRMGRMNSKNGCIYTIAQWYPRMEVYDDISGWNQIPYLGSGEFYLEYGDFDYSITAPADLVVVGSGELLNPSTVLTQKIIDRLASAGKSDKTIFIKDSSDVVNGNGRSRGNLTWHFLCKNARDVAWAASRAYLWDAARIELPDGRKALAQSVYPVESIGTDAWVRSTEYIKASVELNSQKWIEYPYPVATNAAGRVGGAMEYPGMVFCNYSLNGYELYRYTNHEFGHTWFPMIVGSNERKFSWMDEGLNQFIDWIAGNKFNNGEYRHDEESEISGTTSEMIPESADVEMTVPDVMQTYNKRKINYYNPSLGLNILREQILGEKRFDFAFRTYIQRWAYKHPTPWDFFHSMDNASGEDLSWFWNEWFFSNWRIDQSVKEIKYIDSDLSKGALITIENLGAMALPITMEIKEENGKGDTVRLPAEIWQRGGSWTFAYHSTSKIHSIIIDPEQILPDINRNNNSLSGINISPDMTAARVIRNYFDSIGGEDRLRKVKDLKILASDTINSIPVLITKQYKFPGKFYYDISAVNIGSYAHIVTNHDSLQVNIEAAVLNDENNTAFKSGYKMFPELDYSTAGYIMQLDPRLRIWKDRPVYIVTITSPDHVSVKYFYDYKTGLKIRQYTVAPYSPDISYNDYRNTGYGIKSPFSEIIYFPFLAIPYIHGGRIKLSAQNVIFNSEIPDAEFK